MQHTHIGGSTKRHLYWCMKNCSSCPVTLRASIMNISKHYQVHMCLLAILLTIGGLSFSPQNIHTNCYFESPCRHPAYSPSKVLLNDATAIDTYEKALKDTLIYRHAEYYCRVNKIVQLFSCVYSYMHSWLDVNLQCRDTFWVESFNHQLLTFLPKRVHFHTDTFKMRMNFAVMDWVSSLHVHAHCTFSIIYVFHSFLILEWERLTPLHKWTNVCWPQKTW